MQLDKKMLRRKISAPRSAVGCCQIFRTTCGVILLMMARAQSVAKQPTCGSPYPHTSATPPPPPLPPYSSHTPQSAGNLVVLGGELVTRGGYRNWPSDVHDLRDVVNMSLVSEYTSALLCCQQICNRGVFGAQILSLGSLPRIIHLLRRQRKSHARTC